MECEGRQLELYVVCVKREPRQGQYIHIIFAKWSPRKVHRPDDVDIDLHDIDDEDVGTVAGDRQAPHRDHVAVRLLSCSVSRLKKETDGIWWVKTQIDINFFWEKKKIKNSSSIKDVGKMSGEFFKSYWPLRSQIYMSGFHTWVGWLWGQDSKGDVNDFNLQSIDWNSAAAKTIEWKMKTNLLGPLTICCRNIRSTLQWPCEW